MGELDGRVAIITASAGAGIGQGEARVLAEEGASVVITDINEGRIEKFVEELKSKGHRAIGIPCDVTKPDQVNALADKTLKEFGRIDILVNNAGINKLSPLHEMDDETWNMVIGVNLTGAFNCCRAVLPAMIKQNYGRIVNTATVLVWLGSGDGESHYIAAKSGVIGLTRALAHEVAKYNIRVNCVARGSVPNPFLWRIYPAEVLDKILDQIPMGRHADPTELGKAVLFLVSDKSSYLTGNTLSVSGGFVMY